MEANLYKQRIGSADIYRGLVMFLMMAEVLDFQKVAEASNGNIFWNFLAFNQSHVAWVGCSLHDMIQPSFTFLVGVVLPFSIANQSKINNGGILKTLKRSLILVLLGVFLRSMDSNITNWTFEDTLSQIGLGYTFLYVLAFRSIKFQMIAFCCILFFYWLAFAIYPLPGTNFDFNLVGISQNWDNNLSGFAAHWNKNTNLAWAFDHWFMNLFQRESPYTANMGGYVTLSFIPTLATMILGLLAGNILKDSHNTTKIKHFSICAIVLIISGLVFHFIGINPIVKRIWTPSWVLFSGGICYLFLVLFYFLVDVKKYALPFFWLKVIGMNSIAAYVFAHTIVGFIKKSFEIHFGANVFNFFGRNYESLFSGSVILIVLWFLLFWMYKKKLFIRI
jgi:predicted acyltransferase